MNAVRRATQAGDYVLGLERFRACLSASATDLRWGGVCLTALGQLPEAALRLQQAVNQGERGAAIHLASLHFQQGDMTQALAALAQVEPSSLTAGDAALWHRARTRTRWVMGEPREALFEQAQQAWTLAAGASSDVQVSVATLLGSLYSQFGEHAQALAYLTFAAEQGQAHRLPYVALSRTVSLLALGRLDEAQAALESCSGSGVPALLRAELQAQLQWYRGQWLEAQAAFTALLPAVQGHPRTELRAHLGLLALATRTGDRQALLHLYRAEHLTRSAYDQALLDHRAGLWQARTGEGDGRARLLRAQAALESGGHLRETLMVHLALAEVDALHRPQHLHRAAQVATTLPESPFLAPEWPLLPQVFAHLDALPADSFERRALCGPEHVPRLVLRTLCRAALEVDGTPVRFRLARTVELLAYLSRHGAVRLPQIRRDLFPDVPAQRAKNYFHQVRVELAERVPGLAIAYNSKCQTYQVQGKMPLIWDVQELERALCGPLDTMPTFGRLDFLPASESDWAQEERERLRRWVTQVGLETMERWYQTGDYEKCIQLAERLLPLDPLDEALHTFLLNATWHARGELAARHLYRHSASAFVREVGEVPQGLSALERHWRTLH